MSIVTPALYDTISGDATTTGSLSTFEGAPAVFSGAFVPAGVVAPFIRISQEITTSPDDTLSRFGRDILHDIVVVFPNSGSESTMETVAERIRTLLHFTALSVTGQNHVHTIVSGPVGLTSSADEIGLVLQARVRVEDT